MAFDTRPLVAVEFDLYSDTLQGIKTLRLCNRAPLFSRLVPAENYEPRLVTPINLGTSISAQTYGQPMRALENQGVIEFLIGNELVEWPEPGLSVTTTSRFAEMAFAEDLHWIGRPFRVYEGQSTPNNFVEELDLVFVGRITDVSHDTKRCTVRTGDASIDLDAPLVSDLYPTTALTSIASRPRPQGWGTCFAVEPVLIDDINLIYEISRKSIVGVREIRIGGIAWGQSLISPPGAGEWYVDTNTAQIQLGSDTLGGDVRCDVEFEEVSGVGDLITKIANVYDIPIDTAALQELDGRHNFIVGYYARDPINGLAALDDIVTGCGCWWGVRPTGELTAGFIGSPSTEAEIDTILDRTNVLSMSLSQMIPPAWRVPVEYERHWQTQGQFFEGVDEPEKQRWTSTGLKVSREDATIKTAEPRAYDVPTMRSVAITAQNASTINNIFWDAWSVDRKLLECAAWIDPRQISLYQTISVDYMMFRKNYRIMSAVPSIGGGPSQLQLWG